MDQLDDDCMDDAQPREGDDDRDGEVHRGDGRPTPYVEATPGHPRTPQVARRLDMPEEYDIHTPAPGRSRSARGGGQRGAGSATPLAPAPEAVPRPPAGHYHSAQPEPTIRDVLAALTTNHTTTLARLDAFAAVQAAQGKSIERLERCTDDIKANVDDNAAATAALAARVAALEQDASRPGSSAPSSRTSVSSAGRGPPADPHAVDRSIVRVSAATSIPVAAVMPSLKPLLERARVPLREVEVRGSQMARAFVLRHKSGEASKGEDMVEAIMAARRREDGSWFEVTVRTPQNTDLPLYVERDRSHAQRKVGYHLSRATRALRAARPQAKFEIARSAGAVTHEWREVVTIRYSTEASGVVVDWKTDVLESLGIDHDEIRGAFMAMLRDGPAGDGGRCG